MPLRRPGEAELRGQTAELAEFADEASPTSMALTYCDMTTGPTGEVITYEERLAGMERRYGAEHKELHFLTAAQVEALAEVIAPPYGTLIRVVGYTGLRPCEFVALKVGRLDLPRGTVRVAEAAPEVAGHLEWGGVNTP